MELVTPNLEKDLTEINKTIKAQPYGLGYTYVNTDHLMFCYHIFDFLHADITPPVSS